MKKSLFLMLAVILQGTSAESRNYELLSPNNELTAHITAEGNVTISLTRGQQRILNPSEIGMLMKDGTRWGTATKSLKYTTTQGSTDNKAYRQLTLKDNKYAIVFRMYDDGFAYRFEGRCKDSLLIDNEIANFHFADDFKAYVPYIVNRGKDTLATIEQQFWNDQQCRFTPLRLSQINGSRLVAAPFTFALDDEARCCFLETDQHDYPGLYLQSTGGTSLQLQFPHYPKQMVQGGHGNIEMLVTEREDFIAHTTGERTFPWRCFIVSHNDAALAENDFSFRLAEPCKWVDTQWVRPGKAAWDWWNNQALSGVDFKAGFNTSTFKYFVDFAAQYGLEYVLMDEGWFSSKSTDIFDIVPDIDLQDIIHYAQERGVGILLWAGYLSFWRDLEKAASHYAEMGVKGFKIDFFNRDDQLMIQQMEHMAEVCAKNHLLLDYHGTGKPAGWQRTYPNVVNYEAVFGLEQLRWSDKSVDMVTHDVTLPFTRMKAGPMDYTPGAMRNSLKGMYAPNKKNPMSQGTRCHQAALYVIFDAPLTMFCDAPTRYQKDDDYTRFVAQIPTVWTTTKVLAARIGEYIVSARKHEGKWYVGALNNWEQRNLEVSLPMECAGKTLHILADGINAQKVAEDYQLKTLTIPADGRISIPMAAGGGWVGIVK